ncbi:MAG: sensor hybrid histidine kinase [Myxococcales bacterium]|nr:sensor hybrid histidine kinase [Myxococcales bacterium]
MLHSIDDKGQIEDVSDVWLAKLGYTWDEVIGRPSTNFLSEESAQYAHEIVLPAFFVAGVCHVEYEMRRKDGTLMPVRLHGVAVRNETGAFLRSIAVIEDLSEQRALERKVWDAQKLDTLGLMAGNLAHDFNNLLASVVGNAERAQRYAGHLPAAASAIDDILVAASRAADLCRELLAYSGRGQFQIENIDLNSLVVEMVKVLEVNVGNRATVVLDFARPAPYIEVDATQVRQILMNLVINAAEAMGSHTGTITIRTSVRDLDHTTIAASARPEVRPGRYACLEVSDDGSGMQPAVIASIFDPFFTTKETGRGLGLAAVQGIIRGHHGTLVVESQPGRVTTFTVFLPLAEAREVVVKRATSISDGRGTVLVVDDNDLLRRTLATQLEDAGYRVLVAGSGTEAIEIARASSINAFLIDVTMPGVSGPELAVRLHDLSPDARFVLMSGYNNVDMATTVPTRFVQKPFTEEELLRALDQK